MATLRSLGFVDPGWEHGVAQDDKKKKVKCNFCGKVVSGGIFRLKQHLARVSGEVTYCNKAPEEVRLKMMENLEGCRSSKKLRQLEEDGQGYLTFHSNDDDEKGEAHCSYRSKGKELMIDDNFATNMAPLRSLGYVDPGWEHGVAQDERKKKVKCNYCDKIVSGGINRFKQHLARILGEVAPCKMAPEEVYLKIRDNMKWHRSGRRHRQLETKDISSLCMNADNGNGEGEQEVALHHVGKEKPLSGGKRLGKDFTKSFRGVPAGTSCEPFFKRPCGCKTSKRTSPSCEQAKVKMNTTKKTRKEVISAICKFFYYAGMPLHAVNSPYFCKMLELVGQHGPGLVGPPSPLISGRFLQEEILNIRNYLAEYKSSWAITGCSILADSWRDLHGKIVINFLVSCPRGVYFAYSVDATDLVEDASSLFRLLDKLVEDMGGDNVVQVITENTPSYMSAGKMLEEKRRNLFWTPCSAYCIDRMLGDFVKMKLVGECMQKGQKITKFIYNQHWLLNLMKREYTGGHELLRPAIARNASSFSTLQSLLEHRISLRQLFQSNRWRSSQLSKSDEGKEVEEVVLNTNFWKKVQYVVKSVDPIVQLLQKIDNGEDLSMQYIYNDMCRAKLAIKSIHDDDARKYGPFWSVIDAHWDSSFHHPLYLAAYFLNPSYRYRSDFITHPEVIRGLNECIVRLEPDNSRRVSASMQISDYISAKADFGTELAIGTRTKLNPAAWWQQHGINCLELQRIAVRILSQACSCLGQEHKWSIYDHYYSQRHNRVAQKRLSELIYVHYNLRLRECRFKKRSSDLMSLDNALLESLLSDWMVEADKQALQEDEDFLFNEMDQEDGYDNDLIEYEDRIAVSSKGSAEMITLGDRGPLVDNGVSACVSSGNSDPNFIDGDLSD